MHKPWRAVTFCTTLVSLIHWKRQMKERMHADMIAWEMLMWLLSVAHMGAQLFTSFKLSLQNGKHLAITILLLQCCPYTTAMLATSPASRVPELWPSSQTPLGTAIFSELPIYPSCMPQGHWKFPLRCQTSNKNNQEKLTVKRRSYAVCAFLSLTIIHSDSKLTYHPSFLLHRREVQYGQDPTKCFIGAAKYLWLSSFPR